VGIVRPLQGKTGGKLDRDGLRATMHAGGSSADEIAEAMIGRWQFTPLASYRYAAGMTQTEAARRYGEVTTDALARMDASLLSKLEQWPLGTNSRSPTMYHLAVLAVVYDTVPERLLSAEHLRRLPVRDQIALAATRTPVQVGHPVGVAGHGGPGPVDLTYRALFHNLALHSELTEHVIAVLDDIRANIDHTLAAGSVSAGRLDALDEAVADHQHALTAADPLSVLATVALELLEVHALAEQRQPPAAQVRLSAAAAHLCLIVADALTRLDAPHAARAWYRTAHLAADDAGQPALLAITRTQAAAFRAADDPAQVHRPTREARQLNPLTHGPPAGRADAGLDLDHVQDPVSSGEAAADTSPATRSEPDHTPVSAPEDPERSGG
jgi:hypothetical protein